MKKDENWGGGGGGGGSYMQDVADGKAQLHDEFQELQDNQKNTITAILTNPAV